MANQKEEIKKIIRAFNKRRLRYLVIGGVAVVLYGVERATFDLDILLPQDEKEVALTLKIIKRLGYSKAMDEKGRKIVNWKEWLVKKKMLRISSTQRIDLLTLSRAKFDFMYQYKIRVKFAGLVIPLPEIIDLIHLKEWSGRPRDKEDARLLRAQLRLRKKR